MRTPLLPHLCLASDGLWFSAVRYVLTIVKPAFFVKTGIFDSSIKTALYRYFSWGWEIVRLRIHFFRFRSVYGQKSSVEDPAEYFSAKFVEHFTGPLPHEHMNSSFSASAGMYSHIISVSVCRGNISAAPEEQTAFHGNNPLCGKIVINDTQLQNRRFL